MELPPNTKGPPCKHLKDESPPEPNEVRVDEHGMRFRWTDTGYTVRQWFSHETEKGPGPGWFSRSRLLDKDWSIRRFGRVFTQKEAMDPQLLPDDPYYQWQEMEEEGSRSSALH